METVRSADSTEIAFDRSGEGPPLVLVGGAFQDRSSMKTLAMGLQDAFTVYEYDRRGRGNSGNTSSVRDREGGGGSSRSDRKGGASRHSCSASPLEGRSRSRRQPEPCRSGLWSSTSPLSPTGPLPNSQALEKLVADGRPTDAAAAFLELSGTPPTVVAEMRAAPYWPRMEAFAPTLSHEIRVCNNGMVPTDRLAQVSAATLRSPAETAPHGHTKGREQSRTPCPAAKPECSRDKATASPTTCSFPCSRNSSSYRSR
jgi:hypothetical protein